MKDSTATASERQLFLGRALAVVSATLRILMRRETWIKALKAFDFLLSNEIYTYASAAAFNVLIAFFPAAIILLTIVNGLGGASFHAAMLTAIVEYIPADKGIFLRQLGVVSGHFNRMTLLSTAILLFTASGIFVPVELALNYVWKEKGSRHWAVSQPLGVSLLFLFILTAIVPVSMSWAFTTVLEWIFFFLKGYAVLGWIDWIFLKLVTVPFTILAFSVTYWVLPTRKMRIEEVLPAAIFTGFCFEIGKYIYIAILPWLDLREVYGTFATAVAFAMWALFASLMLLMGAYLTHEQLLPRWGADALITEPDDPVHSG